MIFTAKTEAAMLALTATTGDECFRSDISQLYVLSGDPTIASDWTEVKTIGQQILDFMAAALTTAMPGVLVCSERVRPFEQAELPAVNLKLGREVITYVTQVKRTSQGAEKALQIIARMEAAAGGTDSLRVMVVRCMMADRSLGDLALGIGEFEVEWEYEAGSDATNGVLSETFDVKYATTANDPTVKL